MDCKHCHSKNTISRGKQQILCKDCGKHSSIPKGERGTRPCEKCGSLDTQVRGRELFCKSCRKYTVNDEKAEGGKEHREIEVSEEYIKVVCASRRIKSVDDVIREFKIDTKQWRVDKVRAKTSEGYRKDRSVKWKVKEGKATGEVNDSGKMLVVPMYHMEVLFVRKTHEIRARMAIEEMMREAKKDVRKNLTPTPFPKGKGRKKEGMLFEVDFPDVHFGKLTWDEESGENYDIKIAAETVQTAVDILAGHIQGEKIERILLPLGNDFFNVDNKDETTVHGTPQQEDTRWQKTFRMGRRLAVQIIEGLAQIAPVDVLIVPGNHDETRMFFLGDVLDVKYENDKRVTVNNLAMKRKYYSYGRVLLGLTHGYHEKYEKLSFIMSTEQPEKWATSWHREWHLGDKHHKKDLLYGAEDLNGVTIRLLRSLSAVDAWHFDKGFLGAPRGAEAFLWHREDGLVAQYHTTIRKERK